MLRIEYAFNFVIANDIILNKKTFGSNESKFILDHPTAPVVVNVVCQTTSAVVLWRSEINGGSKQEFYVQYWRISQPLPSMLSPSIPDDRLTSDLQYTVENLEPEKHYIYSNNRKELSRGFVVKTGEMYH